jgi:hypothetical protein
VRSARSLPSDASAEQGNRPTPRVHARLPTWWFDFLEGEGGGRPSHKVSKTHSCFVLRASTAALKGSTEDEQFFDRKQA